MSLLEEEIVGTNNLDRSRWGSRIETEGSVKDERDAIQRGFDRDAGLWEEHGGRDFGKADGP